MWGLSDCDAVPLCFFFPDLTRAKFIHFYFHTLYNLTQAPLLEFFFKVLKTFMSFKMQQTNYLFVSLHPWILTKTKYLFMSFFHIKSLEVYSINKSLLFRILSIKLTYHIIFTCKVQELYVSTKGDVSRQSRSRQVNIKQQLKCKSYIFFKSLNFYVFKLQSAELSQTKSQTNTLSWLIEVTLFHWKCQ